MSSVSLTSDCRSVGVVVQPGPEERVLGVDLGVARAGLDDDAFEGLRLLAGAEFGRDVGGAADAVAYVEGGGGARTGSGHELRLSAWSATTVGAQRLAQQSNKGIPQETVYVWKMGSPCEERTRAATLRALTVICPARGVN
jgi:hypothetical protein